MTMHSAPKLALCFLVFSLFFLPRASARDFLIQIELIDLPKTEAQVLLFDRRFTPDMTRLRREVQALVRSGKATLVETFILTSKEGRRVESESIADKIYPLDYIPDRWVTSVPHRAMYEFDTRKIGVHCSAQIKEAEPGVLVCLIGVESVTLPKRISQTTTRSSTGKLIRLHPYLTLSQPAFGVSKFYSSIHVTPGAYHLASQLTSPGKETRSRLTFIRVSPIPEATKPTPKEKPQKDESEGNN